MRRDQIEVRPESLQASGRQLARIATEMADDMAHLQAAVTSNNPWGSDETGTLFAGIYNIVLSHSLQSLASYVEQTGYAAAGLVQPLRNSSRPTTQRPRGYPTLAPGCDGGLMTITLPHELTEPLSWIGFVWPEADEDKLYTGLDGYSPPSAH